ncbi:hypothetical protein ACOSQ4_022732 [Xanthoceras sorbifolium]
MKILDLFIASFIPVLKVLLVTAIGLFLALGRVDILGEEARKHLNIVSFFVFNPTLVASSLAKSITAKSFGMLWFMPVNILFTFIIGSALGWILVKITRAPRNLGNMLLIIIPAVCKERGSPFGNAHVCINQGIAYSSLSMAIGAIYLWSYVYNIMRIFSSKTSEVAKLHDTDSIKPVVGSSENLPNSCTGPVLPLNVSSPKEDHLDQSEQKSKVPFLRRINQCFQTFASKVNLRKLLAPSTIGAIIGFMVGVIPQLRKVLIGDSAPLRVVQDSTSLLGEAAIPTVTLVVGANLLGGLKGSRVQFSVIIGIIAIRYIALPIFGVGIVKAAIHFGLVKSDPLYQFVLLLQFSLPPAINIGTMTQLFGAGKSECSVIMLWTYALASVALTLWSTLFLCSTCNECRYNDFLNLCLTTSILMLVGSSMWHSLCYGQLDVIGSWQFFGSFLTCMVKGSLFFFTGNRNNYNSYTKLKFQREVKEEKHNCSLYLSGHRLQHISGQVDLKYRRILHNGTFRTVLCCFYASSENTRNQLNNVIFYVFSPALVGSTVAKTITFKTVVLLWFMPFNILVTHIIGSLLGWILIKITRAPQHLKGLILGCCAAGNLGYLPLIIIPAVCKEKGSPFGAPDFCDKYGMTYASLSMALGAFFLWSYVYNIVRISSNKVNTDEPKSKMNSTGGKPKLVQGDCTGASHSTKDCFVSVDHKYELLLSCTKTEEITKVSILDKIKQRSKMISRELNLKAIFAPSTTAVIVGFIIGVIPQIRNVIIGGLAPLRVVEDSASMLGDAAIPSVTLLLGANLLRGFKGSGMQLSLIGGIIAVRYVLLPVLGIAIVKGAVHVGMVQSDPLYEFVLLLQYVVPPAMNIGTITQLFGAGESECAVVMLWTYGVASVSLTVWSTFFMWLLSA